MFPEILIYGPSALISVGVVMSGVSFLAGRAFAKDILGHRRWSSHVLHGVLTGSNCLVICGVLLSLGFAETSGIERLIGSLLVLLAPLASIGVGCSAKRASLTMSDEPE